MKVLSKILIIRFSSIGDIVLTTPSLRCLKRQLQPEIHYLTKAAYASILRPNPYIDRLWTFEKRIEECLPQLAAEKFDYLFDWHKNLRSLRLRLRLRRPARSFQKLNWQKWLLVNTQLNRLPPVHLVDRYFQALTPWNIQNDGNGLDFFIDSKD